MSNHPDSDNRVSQFRGSDLREGFLAAAGLLEDYRDTVNALNVFPVPDGDTGTNMLLTMRSAAASFPENQNPPASEVAWAMAQGAFFGARGNSGVILSQFFQGFSNALQESRTVSGEELARAFESASDAAYGSVGQPVEGHHVDRDAEGGGGGAGAGRRERRQPGHQPVGSGVRGVVGCPEAHPGTIAGVKAGPASSIRADSGW